MESEPTFKGCMVKTTRHYYKEVFGVVGVVIIIFALLLVFGFICAFLITKSNVALALLMIVWLAITFMMTSSIVHDVNITSTKGVVYSWVTANILLFVGLCGVVLIVMCNAVIPFIVAIGVCLITFYAYGLGIATLMGTISLLLTIPPTMAFVKCIKLWDWIVSCFRTSESLLYDWIKSMV